MSDVDRHVTSDGVVDRMLAASANVEKRTSILANAAGDKSSELLLVAIGSEKGGCGVEC
jgi:hypothetical protein